MEKRLKFGTGGTIGKRLKIIKRSLSYWIEKPVIGIGLGSYIWKSQKDGIPDDVITIHNSANWLLVETGIVGLVLFSIFIYICIKTLMSKNDYTNILPTYGMASIILVMIGASIGTEVIYQRYFWLLLGISMAKAGELTALSTIHTK